jgi:hypothetical protein
LEYLGGKISEATLSQELVNVALKEFDEVISGMEKSISVKLSPEERQKIDKAREKLNKARMEINSVRKDIELISEDIKVEADRRHRYQSVSPREPTTEKATKHVQYQDDLHNLILTPRFTWTDLKTITVLRNQLWREKTS